MSFMVYGRELYRTSPFLGKSFGDGSKPIFDYTIGGTKVYFHAVWVFTSGHQWSPVGRLSISHLSMGYFP